MISRTLFIILAAVIWAGGCDKDTPPKTFSNMNVKMSSNPEVKFSVGSQFALVKQAFDLSQNDDAAMINQRIQTALANELTAKGYKASDPADADFFVGYSLKVQQEMDDLMIISKEQGNEWIAAILSPEGYAGGALFVQIVDARKKIPVWLGVFNAEISLSTVSEEKKQERVAYAVRELLKSFSPQ
jgi:hypothetical protein